MFFLWLRKATCHPTGSVPNTTQNAVTLLAWLSQVCFRQADIHMKNMATARTAQLINLNMPERLKPVRAEKLPSL